MADSDRIVEIIIETNDKTGGALGAVQNKLLAFDKAVLRTQERLKRMTKVTYQASISLIDKVTPQGSKINSLLKGFAGKAYQATIGLIDRTTGGIRSLEAKLMQLTGKAYNVTVGIKDQASKGIKNIADSALMQTTGMGLSMLGTAGIGYGVVNAFQSQMDFEKQMSSVKAIIGDKADVVLSVDADTGKATTAFDALVAKAEEMGAMTKFTSGEAAQGLYYMGMAGWDADKQMAGLPALMNLAAAANEDLARTSDIMTDSMTGFGVNAGDMIRNASGEYVEASQHFADLLAAVATGANTDVSTMGETFKYSASSIQAMYSSGTAEDRMRGAEDLALITGIMANAGIKGSQAGTSQKALFTRLSALQRNADYARSSLGVDFVDQETGQTRRLRDVIGDFRKRFNEGVSPDEMIDLAERLGGGEKIQKDTKKKLSSFLEHVQENGGKMTDSDKMMMTSMLSGQEAMSGWLAAFLASDEDWNRLAKSIDNCDGKAEEMAKIQLDNLAGDITMLGSAWDAFQRSFVKGEASEGLRGFIQSVTETISKANELFKDGIDIGDFGTIILDVVTKLKNKFLEFDGIGSILAGGVLAGGLVKLTQKAMGLMDKLKSLKDLASGFGGNDGNGNAGIGNGANNRGGVGNNGMNGASSKVGTMTVNANVVNINSRNSGGSSGGNGVGGNGNGGNKGNRNNGNHSGAGAGTGGHGGTGNPPPPPSGNPPPSSGSGRFGRMAKVGGGLLTAATVALSAYDIYDTNRSYDEQSAEIDKKDQKAQENFDLMTAKHEMGEVSDEEYAQARQRLTDQQNKSAEERQQLETDRTNDMGAAVGGTVGSVAGGAIGAVVGGPVGAMVGSMIGSEIGTMIGGNITEIQKAFEGLPQIIEGIKGKLSDVWED